MDNLNKDTLKPRFIDGNWYKVTFESKLIRIAYSSFQYDIHESPVEKLVKLEYMWWENKRTYCKDCKKIIKLNRPMEVEEVNPDKFILECPYCKQKLIKTKEEIK